MADTRRILIPTVLFLLVIILATQSLAQKTHLVNSNSPIDLTKDKAFISYFRKFKLLVKNNDSIAMAEFMKDSFKNEADEAYSGINCHLVKKGSKIIKYEDEKIKIKTRLVFLKYYARIFDKKMRQMISEQTINDLQLMPAGIMMYRGQVWWTYDLVSRRIKTFSLNNNNITFDARYNKIK